MEKFLKIQQLLENVNFENLGQTLEYFSSNWVGSNKDLLFFSLKDIFILSKLKPENIVFYSRIINAIETSTNDPDELAKKLVIVFIRVNSKKEESLAYIFKLLLELYNCGLYDIEEITNILKKEKFSEKNYFLFFLIFAAHIKRYQYNELLYKISNKYQKDDIFKQLEKKIFSEVETLINYGYSVDSVNFAIKFDNLEKLQEIAAKQFFDFNQIISFSDFECKTFPEENISLIEFAAFFGAEKCFEFILNNSQNTNLMNKRLMKFAVFGGNQKIIEICKQSSISFKNTLGVSAFERNNEVFEFVLNETCRADINNEDEIFEAVCEGCKVNNIKVVKKLVENFKLKPYRLGSKCPLDFCIENECVECAMILFDNEVIYNPLCLHRALRNRIDKIAMRILESGNSCPHMRDEEGQTAVDIAAESCTYEEAVALYKNSHVKPFITHDLLNKAYDYKNYDFLAAFSDLSTFQPSSNNKAKSKATQKYLAIFFVASVLIIILWISIFTKI